MTTTIEQLQADIADMERLLQAMKDELASLSQPPAQPPPSSQTLSVDLGSGATVITPGQKMRIGPLWAWYSNDGSLVLGNNYMDATADVVLTGVSISTGGGKVIFAGDLTIPPNACAPPFWITQPTAHAPDPSHFFRYADIKTDWLARYNASNTRTRLWTVALGTTGSRPDISPETAWDTAYLVNPTADNATVVRGMADIAATIPMQAIDPATNDFVSLSSYPKASMIGPQRGKPGNPIAAITQSSSPWNLSQAQAHAPEVGHVAYWTFGTEYDQWINEAWALYTGALWLGSGYRLNGGNGPCQMAHVQPRGQAWGLRNMVQAATIGGPHATMFGEWVKLQLADMQAYVSSHAGDIPVDLLWVDQEYARRRYQFRMNSFMNDFLVMALAYATLHGFSEAQAVGQYFGAFPVQRMTQPLAPQGIPMPQLATIYDYLVARPDNTWVADWASAIAVTAAAVAAAKPGASGVLTAALKLDPTSQAFQTLFGNKGHEPGDFICDSPASDTDYAARLGTVLNCCKILGVSGVDQALSAYDILQRVRWNDPQWAVQA